MAIENINVGANPNDGTGTPLRNAFEIVNENFDQIESDLATKANTSDLANYDTKAEVNTKITTATNPIIADVQNLSSRTTTIEGDIEQINTELDTLATINYVDALKAMLEVDINGLDTRVTAIETELPNKLSDAPSNGNQYARKDGAWVIVSGGGGTVDAYTKAETDALLAPKANITYVDAEITDVTNMISSVNNVMNQYQIQNQNKFTEVDGRLDGLDTLVGTKIGDAPSNGNQYLRQNGSWVVFTGGTVDAYTKSETDTLLAAKANQSTTYTKTETDTLLNTKANQSTTYTITQVDNLLDEKVSNDSLNTIISDAISASRRIVISTATATVDDSWSNSYVLFTSNCTVTIPRLISTKQFVVKANDGVTVTFSSSYISANSTGNVVNSKEMAYLSLLNSNHTITVFQNKGGSGSDAVLLTGDQTIAGVKTFSSSPKAPVATANDDVVIKQQMDSALDGKVSQTYFDTFEAVTEADIIALENNVSTLQGSVGTLDGRVSSVEGQLGNKVDNSTFTALDNNVVKLNGDQSMNGVKEFSSSPIVPTPTTATQTANKQYVDNTISDVLTNRKTITTITTVDASYHKAIVFVTGNATITIPSTLGFVDFVVKCNATSTATFAMGSGSTLDESSTGLIVEPKGMASVITMGSNIIITGGI